MKKVLTIFIVNIVLFGVFYFLLFFFIKEIENGKIRFEKQTKQIITNNSSYNVKDYIEDYPPDFVRIKLNDRTYTQFCGENRTIINENYTKAPIVIFGCSYAYGHGLKREETLSYKLSNLTQRPVYNFARCGDNPVISLNTAIDYINDNPDFENKLSKAEYVVYVYMYNHIGRLISLNKNIDNDYTGIFQHSKIEQFFSKNRITRHIVSRMKEMDLLEDYPNTDKSEIFLKGCIKRWAKSVSKYIPNAQIIIILYDEKIVNENANNVIFYRDLMSSYIWKEIELESKGKIKIVHSQDLAGIIFDKNYKLKKDIADWHPNEKAWNLLTPLLVQKYIK